MSSESLEQAIENAEKELGGREGKKNIAWFIITTMLFGIPLYLFMNAPDSVYQSSYAPMAVGWFMIAMVLGHYASASMFASRTIELHLQLEIAKAIRNSSKTSDK